MSSQNGPAGDSDDGDPPKITQDIPPIPFAGPGPAQEPVPSVKASDADRERAIDALIEAFAEGRLTTEELRARTEQAYQARTHAELATVSADLPAEPTGPTPAQPGGPATDLTTTAPRRTNSLAVAALVCSLIPGPPGLAALILGIVALRQIRRTGERGTALAAAALAIVALGPVITMLLVLLCLRRWPAAGRRRSDSLRSVVALRAAVCSVGLRLLLILATGMRPVPWGPGGPQGRRPCQRRRPRGPHG